MGEPEKGRVGDCPFAALEPENEIFAALGTRHPALGTRHSALGTQHFPFADDRGSLCVTNSGTGGVATS